jgi:hypothetical protein
MHIIGKRMYGYFVQLFSEVRSYLKIKSLSWAWWLMPIIPAIWEVEMRGLRFETACAKRWRDPHLNK